MDELPRPLFAPPPVTFGVGQQVITTNVFVFRCPLCRREFRHDDRFEPLCTGPGWMDTHAPEVMRLWRVETARVIAQLGV